MDWTPSSPEQADILTSLRTFNEQLPDLEEFSFVWGVGVVNVFGELYPLVIVDHERLTVRFELPPRGILHEEDLDGALQLTVGRLREGSPWLFGALPDQTRVLPAGRPEPLGSNMPFSSGEPIRDTAAPHPR